MKYVFITILVSLSLALPAQTRPLDFFILHASENSPLLKDYRNQILAYRLDSQIIKASLRNQINFISNNSYAPVFQGWGYDEAITNIANVSALIQATRSFMQKNNIAAQMRSLSLQSRSLNDSIRLSQKDLEKSVTEQYITAYGNMLTMDYNKEVFELLRSEEAILKKLTQKSVFKQTDYLNFYVTMQQQELIYLQSEIQYNTDYLTLNYFAGLVDTSIQRISYPDISGSVIYGDGGQPVFFKRFVTDSLKLENEKILLEYQYKPKLGAYADGGFNSTLHTTPYKNIGFSAGISLTIPIYDGHQKEMKYNKINLQERTRQSNREFFINQYNQQVALLKKQVNSISLLENKINQQITYTKTLITANGQLLQTGDISMKDYILALNNYLNARNMLTQNNISRLRLINQINYWTR